MQNEQTKEKENKCTVKFLLPRLAVLAVLITLAVLAIVFKEQIQQLIQAILSWV